jgi:hypothetical protein
VIVYSMCRLVAEAARKGGAIIHLLGLVFLVNMTNLIRQASHC